MCKICVFAGTTEGRKIVGFLTGQGATVTACVATEYGEALLSPAETLTVRTGRLSKAEMEALFAAENFDLVVDATHPYAREVTENLVEACRKTDTESCAQLPAPSHVFIGGSSGNLPEILDCILEKNPEARIVATALSLETIAALQSQRSRFEHAGACSLTVARDRKVGGYTLMNGQNPIYIFTFQGGKNP